MSWWTDSSACSPRKCQPSPQSLSEPECQCDIHGQLLHFHYQIVVTEIHSSFRMHPIIHESYLDNVMSTVMCDWRWGGIKLHVGGGSESAPGWWILYTHVSLFPFVVCIHKERNNTQIHMCFTEEGERRRSTMVYCWIHPHHLALYFPLTINNISITHIYTDIMWMHCAALHTSKHTHVIGVTILHV